MKAIFFSFLVAIPALTATDDPNDPFDASLNPRIERINAEIAGLKQHAWAGEYSTGDVFSSLTLWIAPESGAVFQSSGCMHHDRCEGDIESREGLIEIDWERQDVDEPFVAGREYVPIHWGRATLIVPIGRLHSFCIAARQNTSVPVSWRFEVLRRTNDEPILLTQLSIPDKYQRLLELPPITAKIASVGEPVRTKESRWNHSIAQELQLDVGAHDDVFVGMQFELVRRGLSHQIVTITSVTPNKSTGMMYARAKGGQRLSPARRNWSVQTVTWR